jgi:hypothetical protein
MPVPQVPRRAAPPRKKSSQKQTPPAETEADAKGASIHDSSDTYQSPLVAVPGDVEPDVGATDPDADDVYPSDLADKNLEPTEQSYGYAIPQVLSPEAESTPGSASSPLDPQPDNPEVDPSPLQAPDDIAEPTVSIPTASRITQEETEVGEVAVLHADDDEALVSAEEEEDEDDARRIAERDAEASSSSDARRIAERVAEEPTYIGGGVIAVESDPAAPAVVPESIPYSVFQQGGGATAVNEEDDGNDGEY